MRHQLYQLLQPRTNAAVITHLLTKLLHVDVTQKSIQNEVEKHPNFPSLLSISDVLARYGVSNISVQVESAKLPEAPVPFITQIEGKESGTAYFTVVTEINSSLIHFLDPELQKGVVTELKCFLDRWTNIILIAEPGENAGERNYRQIEKQEQQQKLRVNIMTLWLPVMVLLAGLFAVIKSGEAAVLPFFFAVCNLLGSGASSLLLWYELDQHNPVLAKFCGSGEDKINCNAILSSKASKIWGISWSAVGFTYFTGGLLLQMIIGIMNYQILFILSWISLLASPYVIYSIVYQWRIAKHWCSLCLFVQLLLSLQLIVSLTGQWQSMIAVTTIHAGTLLQLVTAFSFPFMLILIVFGTLRQLKEKEDAHLQLQRVKHNPVVFESLLEKQQRLTNSSSGLGICIGATDAPYKIIKVCNPYCSPCAKAHTSIEEILDRNPEVQLQIIFTATDDQSDYRGLPVKHLMAIHEHDSEEITRKALNDWYVPDQKDYNAFAALYQRDTDLQQQDRKLAAMADWCGRTGITHTPTFFISIPQHGKGNDHYYKLPELYTSEDLKYLFSV